MSQGHSAEPVSKTDLEVYNKGGWDCYRIPGVVVTRTGTILAYYETRLSADDWSARNIGLRRSKDEGFYWGPRTELVKNGEEGTVNNPVMIACGDGAAHFLWQRNYLNVYHQISWDDGETWSEAVEITGYLEEFRKQYLWTAIAMGPGHGIETSGGRLLVPVWMSNGGGRSHTPSATATIYSDDAGRTWQCGEIIGSSTSFINPNEASLAELSDGHIMINIRHETGNRRRAVSVSPDGAGRWSEPWFDAALPDPVCFGSMLRMPQSHDLLFSNCATEGSVMWSRSRKNLTLKLSQNGGATWPHSMLIERRSGYSDLAASPDGRWIYCFHEKGWARSSCASPAALAMARIDTRVFSHG